MPKKTNKTPTITKLSTAEFNELMTVVCRYSVWGSEVKDDYSQILSGIKNPREWLKNFVKKNLHGDINSEFSYVIGGGNKPRTTIVTTLPAFSLLYIETFISVLSTTLPNRDDLIMRSRSFMQYLLDNYGENFNRSNISKHDIVVPIENKPTVVNFPTMCAESELYTVINWLLQKGAIPPNVIIEGVKSFTGGDGFTKGLYNAPLLAYLLFRIPHTGPSLMESLHNAIITLINTVDVDLNFQMYSANTFGLLYVFRSLMAQMNKSNYEFIEQAFNLMVQKGADLYAQGFYVNDPKKEKHTILSLFIAVLIDSSIEKDQDYSYMVKFIKVVIQLFFGKEDYKKAITSYDLLIIDYLKEHPNPDIAALYKEIQEKLSLGGNTEIKAKPPENSYGYPRYFLTKLIYQTKPFDEENKEQNSSFASEMAKKISTIKITSEVFFAVLWECFSIGKGTLKCSITNVKNYPRVKVILEHMLRNIQSNMPDGECMDVDCVLAVLEISRNDVSVWKMLLDIFPVPNLDLDKIQKNNTSIIGRIIYFCSPEHLRMSLEHQKFDFAKLNKKYLVLLWAFISSQSYLEKIRILLDVFKREYPDLLNEIFLQKVPINEVPTAVRLNSQASINSLTVFEILCSNTLVYELLMDECGDIISQDAIISAFKTFVFMERFKLASGLYKKYDSLHEHAVMFYNQCDNQNCRDFLEKLIHPNDVIKPSSVTGKNPPISSSVYPDPEYSGDGDEEKKFKDLLLVLRKQVRAEVEAEYKVSSCTDRFGIFSQSMPELPPTPPSWFDGKIVYDEQMRGDSNANYLIAPVTQGANETVTLFVCVPTEIFNEVSESEKNNLQNFLDPSQTSITLINAETGGKGVKILNIGRKVDLILFQDENTKTVLKGSEIKWQVTFAEKSKSRMEAIQKGGDNGKTNQVLIFVVEFIDALHNKVARKRLQQAPQQQELRFKCLVDANNAGLENVKIKPY